MSLNGIGDAENLVAFMDAALPLMKANWRKWHKRGYDARKSGQPRMVHGRRSAAGMWLKGWDEADKHESNLATSKT